MLNINSKKGVSLYIAVIILTIMLAMVFGLSAIVSNQIRMIRGMGDSVAALYAADTGIERVLYNIRIELGDGTGLSSLDEFGSGYGYSINKISCGAKTCLQSVGTYKQTKRAIEASY